MLPVSKDEPVVVSATSLTMVALFGPLRRRVQSFVDRRFYRSRYDATRTLDDFGERLRQETHLGEITDDLGGIVRATF